MNRQVITRTEKCNHLEIIALMKKEIDDTQITIDKLESDEKFNNQMNEYN